MTEGGHPRFDLYPDVSDYSPRELYDVPGLTLPDGGPAKLFSSRNQETLRRHFNIMALHSIDGAFLMRMANECEIDRSHWTPRTDLARANDELLDRVRFAAENEGRVWAIM